MKYLVIDLETSIKNVGDFSIGKFKASPFHPDNKIVALGAKRNGDLHTKTFYHTDYDIPSYPVEPTEFVIGQNIKFDLLYLLRYPQWREWMARGRIWDTALAEYILTGQQAKYVNLDTLSQKYGGTLKPDVIKQYWEDGIDTEDIPKEDLLDYLKGDVSNTEIVALGQMKAAYKRGLFPLIAMEMEALLATTEMEWNGLCFDKDYAEQAKEDLATHIAIMDVTLRGLMSVYLPKLNARDILPTSPKQLSVVLFGGIYSYDYDEQVIDETTGEPYRYKSGPRKGQIKTKKAVGKGYTAGMCFSPQEEWKTKTPGIYSTGEDVLKALKPIPFISTLLEYRKLKKDYSTYFDGYSKLVWPDGCIHGKIDHVGTNTARFNSSQPNLQNLSGKDK